MSAVCLAEGLDYRCYLTFYTFSMDFSPMSLVEKFPSSRVLFYNETKTQNMKNVFFHRLSCTCCSASFCLRYAVFSILQFIVLPYILHTAPSVHLGIIYSCFILVPYMIYSCCIVHSYRREYILGNAGRSPPMEPITNNDEQITAHKQ